VNHTVQGCSRDEDLIEGLIVQYYNQLDLQSVAMHHMVLWRSEDLRLDHQLETMSKLLITIYIILCPFLLLTNRKKALYHLLVASVIAVFWMLYANGMYSYNMEMLTVYDFTLFPAFAWAVGLFVVYMAYSKSEDYIKIQSMLKKVILFVAIYWVFLLVAETIAYHIIGFQNLATATYSGLPVCDCLHAPRWMKAVYMAMGPVYFLVCWGLGLEKKVVA
jgi:hypothetical protein